MCNARNIVYLESFENKHQRKIGLYRIEFRLINIIATGVIHYYTEGTSVK